MTIKDLSEKASMNYNTARKYFIALKEEGLAEDPEIDLVPMLHEIARLSSEGKTVKQAIESIKKRGVSVESDDMKSLKSEVNELRKQVMNLSDLLQIELSKQKALPESIDKITALNHQVQRLSSLLEKQEQAGFWYRVKAAFSSLFRRK